MKTRRSVRSILTLGLLKAREEYAHRCVSYSLAEVYLNHGYEISRWEDRNEVLGVVWICKVRWY